MILGTKKSGHFLTQELCTFLKSARNRAIGVELLFLEDQRSNKIETVIIKKRIFIN